MRFHRRLKRSTKQYIIVAMICIIIIGGAAALTSIIITGQIREEYRVLLKEAYDEMKENQRNVYIAAESIASGEVIKKDMVERKIVYSSQPQDSYITDKDIGKTALVKIASGTQILGSMITEHNVSAKLRETEYQVINMNSNITKNDTVDIRIFYPNGESYVVLTKKEIKAYTPETASVYLWLEEDELLRMSAAIVDAALYTGSKLYVTKYIEPNIQEASVITYTPSLSLLSLIEDDPNIIERCSQKLNKEIRKALENRLADNLSKDVSSINWKVNKENSFVTNTSKPSEASQLQQDKENSPGYRDKNNTANEARSENEAGIITPTPTPATENNTEVETQNSDNELGSEDYFYYARNPTESDEIEYGE